MSCVPLFSSTSCDGGAGGGPNMVPPMKRYGRTDVRPCISRHGGDTKYDRKRWTKKAFRWGGPKMVPPWKGTGERTCTHVILGITLLEVDFHDMFLLFFFSRWWGEVGGPKMVPSTKGYQRTGVCPCKSRHYFARSRFYDQLPVFFWKNWKF